MSLTLARRVHEKYPHLLQRNTGADCHQFTLHLIEALRAANHIAFLMCKTAGEGQYTPMGFQSREVKGFDGKTYTCTGVSHDAIWCDGRQFDTIGNANDGPDPLGSPGVPVWNAIPEPFWRPQNPPLKMDPVIVNPPAPPAQLPPYPQPETAVDGAGVALFADFAVAGQAPNPQMFRFAFRVAYDWLAKNEPSLDASVAKHRNEWRALLGLPPL